MCSSPERAVAKVPESAEGRRAAADGARSPSSAPARWAAASRSRARTRGFTVRIKEGYAGCPRCGYRDDSAQLRIVGQPRPADAGRRRGPARAHPTDSWPTTASSDADVDRRSGLREPRAEEADFSPSSTAWPGRRGARRRTRRRSTSTRSRARPRRPGDVIGLHFFSPAHVMRLLEIVRGQATQARRARHRVSRSPSGWGRSGWLVGELPRVRRQPHDVPLHVRSAVPGRRGRDARTGRPGAHGFRDGDGHFRGRRHGGHRRRVASAPGIRVTFATEVAAGRWWPTSSTRWAELGQKTGSGWYRYDDERASPHPTRS